MQVGFGKGTDSERGLNKVSALDGLELFRSHSGAVNHWKYFVLTPFRRFGIKSIPHAVLVDGDTGLIVACGEDARGPKLAAAIEDALAKKRSAAR